MSFEYERLDEYERLEKEIDTIIAQPNSYVMLMGDLVDGFFWNPAQIGIVPAVLVPHGGQK